MKPTFHFIVSLPLIAILYPFFGIKSFLILIGSFLIDLDHYLWYMYNSKDYNPIKSYKWFVKVLKQNKFSQQRRCVIVFHTIEFLILITILSFYSETALLILIGLLYHYIFDTINVLFIAKDTFAIYSVIWWFIKYRKIKK